MFRKVKRSCSPDILPSFLMKGDICLLLFNLHKPKNYFLDTLLAKIIPGIYICKSPLQPTEQHSSGVPFQSIFPLEKLKGVVICHTNTHTHTRVCVCIHRYTAFSVYILLNKEQGTKPGIRGQNSSFDSTS